MNEDVQYTNQVITKLLDDSADSLEGLDDVLLLAEIRKVRIVFYLMYL